MPLTPNDLLLLASILLLILLALILLVVMGSIRLPLITAGKVKIPDIATDRRGWPAREWAMSNAFDNQFQLPVLFYVAALIAIGFGATLFEVILGFVFVVLRYAHAYIHVTDNHVIRRFTAYTAGLAILCVFWLDLVVRLILIAFGAS